MLVKEIVRTYYVLTFYGRPDFHKPERLYLLLKSPFIAFILIKPHARALAKKASEVRPAGWSIWAEFMLQNMFVLPLTLYYQRTLKQAYSTAFLASTFSILVLFFDVGSFLKWLLKTRTQKGPVDNADKSTQTGDSAEAQTEPKGPQSPEMFTASVV